MIVSVFTKKGGTGRTSIAYNIAKDLGWYLLSNDNSIIEEQYDKAKIVSEFSLVNPDIDCVYDFGGFINKSSMHILEKSDLIIVPTTLDANSVKRAVNTITEISANCGDIVIVINRIKSTTIKKYTGYIGALKGFGRKIFQLRESEIMINTIHNSETINSLFNKNKLNKRIYKSIHTEYNLILDEIKRTKIVTQFNLDLTTVLDAKKLKSLSLKKLTKS